MGPERLQRWLDGFQDRHGHAVAAREDSPDGASTVTTFLAADGSVAHCHAPFPPVPVHGAVLADLLAHGCADREVGVLLVRRGGFAVGVFHGVRLLRSKVGTRYVQGATAAGGWSQQRFARRREGQARTLVGAVTEVAVRLLAPPEQPDHLVTGGDRRLVADVLGDPRLRMLRSTTVRRFLDVGDPRQVVLEATPAAFRAVRIRVVEAPTG